MTQPLLVNLAPAVSTDVCRWCFQHWGIPHREQLHVPVFHVLALALQRTSNDNRPVVGHQGQRFATEPEIVAHFDPLAAPERQLVPQDQDARRTVLAERRYYHKTMRRGVVQYMYWNLLKSRALVWSSFTTDVPSFERWLAGLMFPLIGFGLRKGLDLSEQNARAAIDVIHRGFDRAEASLADGRPFLTGDRFTIADLTFAASAAPAVLADGYGGNLPKITELPDDMQAVVREFRARPAGAFARRMYGQHRHKG